MNKVRVELIAAVVVALAVIGGIAYATIPDSNGVIHGCYKKSGGTLRVIDSAVTSCDPNNETSLKWNQTGPPGPTEGVGSTSLKETLQRHRRINSGTVSNRRSRRR
jgi:hypothetical protein